MGRKNLILVLGAFIVAIIIAIFFLSPNQGSSNLSSNINASRDLASNINFSQNVSNHIEGDHFGAKSQFPRCLIISKSD